MVELRRVAWRSQLILFLKLGALGQSCLTAVVPSRDDPCRKSCRMGCTDCGSWESDWTWLPA